MDDILYILLGIAWLGWSLYSNKQKMDKKRAAQGQEYDATETAPPPRPRNIFDEILSDELPEQAEAKQEEYIPEIEEQIWQKMQAEYAKSEAESLEKIVDEVPSDYFTRQYALHSKEVFEEAKPILLEDSELKGKSEIGEEFDLKKAVIFSEILRAPYIEGSI